MGRVFLFVLCIVTAICTPGRAQRSQYSLRNYTVIDGLPQSQVITMLEDRNGYLWVGTQGGGLARFDGREFNVYSTKDGLFSNEVIGLKFDSRQNLWILHPRGITRFDGRSFIKLNDSHPARSAKQYRQMLTLNDSLFVVSANGMLTKIYQDSIHYTDKPLLRDNIILLAHQHAPGALFYLLNNGTCYVETAHRNYKAQLPEGIGKVFNIFSHKDQIILRSDKGMYAWDYKAGRIVPVAEDPEFWVLLYDATQDFYWTTNGNALFKEWVCNGRIRRDTVLTDARIEQVLRDSEGNTWFASNGRGLYKYYLREFERITNADGALPGVMAILREKDGRQWVGTMGGGLQRIHNGKVQHYRDTENPYRNSISGIKKSPGGIIWVASGHGLGRYNEAGNNFSWFVKEDGLASNKLICLDFDRQGNLWCGTNNGMSYYDGKTFRNYTMADGLLSNMVLSLHYAKQYKTLFIGTDVGLQYLRDGRMQQVIVPGVSNTSFMQVTSFRDSLMLASTGGAGVIIVDPESNARKIISTREGLASDFIYFAVADEDDFLWVGSEKGINRLRLDYQLEVIENLSFDYDNGLTGVETNQGAYFITPEHKYFGLVDGLYEYRDLGNFHTRSFDLHLTDVQILYGEYSSRTYTDSLSGFFKIPHQPNLPPDKNHVTFQFNRVDKRYPKSVKFRYYLENFDKTWSQPSSMSQATYGNLPPGDYVFRVMATNNKGSWSGARIAYPFTVLRPFYKAPSFIVGAFVLIAGLATLALYIRVKRKVNRVMMLERIRMKEQDNLRKEIARDFHDEMGNQLTRIINYISLLKLNAMESNGHTNSRNQDLYTKVEDSAKYLYTGTRDFIWSIDPGNDELSKLFLHIRDFAEKLFEEKSISFRAYNEVREKVRLPYGFSREANLIFKESMTNAFKYSEARNVTLSLKRDDDGFEMSFEDDGIGFATDDVEKMNGLQNIRERADKINGILRIQSIKNQGTKITLNFKLTKTLKYGLAL